MGAKLVYGTLGAIAGAFVGAIVWAAIASSTGYQIGFVAVGVGFLAGYGMRTLGGGRARADGVIAGIVALCGCALGNLFADASTIATHVHRDVQDIALRLLLHPDVAFDVLRATFNLMDLVFYAIAIYTAYRAAMRPAMPPPAPPAARAVPPPTAP